SEDVPDLKIGVDLIAAIYRGLLSYSYILKLNGDTIKAEYYEKKAKSYQKKIEQDWWDNTDSLYKTYYTTTGKFGKGNGEVFLLWFDVLKDKERVLKTIEHLVSEKLNIETQSYLPVILYNHGSRKEAYDYIIHLASPDTKRREYPEVSFGVIEGIVQGLMGIEPDAEINRISTIYRGQNEIVSQLDSLPILGTNISIKHEPQKTYFYNNGEIPIYWRAQFAGNYQSIFANNRKVLAKHKYDKSGNLISFIDTKVSGGKKMIASCRE
ncbi:MAG: trehalase family glycosidase, partial [Ginsengibacter sp.]